MITFLCGFLGRFLCCHYLATMSTNLSQKVVSKFSCSICDYNTSKKYDYEKHMATDKHKINNLATDGNNSATQMSPIEQFICNNCNKNYKCRTGLWRHKNKGKCDYKGNEKDKDLTACNNDSDSDSEYNMIKSKNNEDLIAYLIKENAEFKQLLIEQNKQMIEMCKNAGNSNNNTNSHNKSFNLQFFLNETCKDALNISDFVKSIKPSLEELESTGRLGYVEGVSNIILKNLTTLDTSRRPIHCTDIKREILYVKDNDEWIKEQDDKPVLTKAIKVIANENIKNISEWRKENPGCTDSDSRKNNMYLKIVSNAMSGSSSDESCKNINKIIGNVSKNVVVDR
jgi:hypothetical protein